MLLCDDGRPRNACSRGVHGFLTRDGMPPADLRQVARAQLAPYGSVDVRDVAVAAAGCAGGGFTVTLDDGARVRARKLLVAMGITHDVPEIDGFRALWGAGVHNCPYCDGWEHRDQRLAAYVRGRNGKGLALELTTWSRDVVLLTDGPADLPPDDRADLDRNGIRVIEDRIARLEGGEGGLERVRFASGEALAVGAVFFAQGEAHVPDLIATLDCDLTAKGTVRTRAYEKTNVPGLYVAGDASRGVQFAIVAAAEGAMAAFAINCELVDEDARRGGPPPSSVTASP